MCQNCWWVRRCFFIGNMLLHIWMLLPHSLEYTYHIFKYHIWHSNFFYNKEVWAVSLFSNYHTIKQQSAESKVYNSCSLEVDINLKNSFIAPLFVVIWSGFAKPYPCLQVHCPVRLLKSIYVRNILELCPQWYKADNFVCKLDDLVWPGSLVRDTMGLGLDQNPPWGFHPIPLLSLDELSIPFSVQNHLSTIPFHLVTCENTPF